MTISWPLIDAVETFKKSELLFIWSKSYLKRWFFWRRSKKSHIFPEKNTFWCLIVAILLQLIAAWLIIHTIWNNFQIWHKKCMRLFLPRRTVHISVRTWHKNWKNRKNFRFFRKKKRVSLENHAFAAFVPSRALAW